MTSPKRLPKWILRLAIGVLAPVLLLGVSYLLFGWGLHSSDRHGTYRLIGHWTEANGRRFDDPFGIAVDPRNGNVLVTDARNQRVVEFDGAGAFIREFGTPGDGPGQFDRPTGVTVGPDGSIYVADYDLDRIQKFSETGEFVLAWGSSGEGRDQFQSPNGLAVNRQGHVYVADFQNKVVKVFDGNGRFLRSLGTAGQWGPGKLDYPTDVDVAPDGTVLVADAYNYRVQEFSAAGQHEASWGWHLFWLVPRPSNASAGFDVPTGVAFGRAGRFMHVADSANHRIVLLDRDGGFVTDWMIPEPGQVYSPTTLAVSPDGKKLYATDTATDRVIVLAVETKDSK